MGDYLSIEVVAKDEEPLWPYLVIPNKFAWASIEEDLAKNMVKEMLAAREADALSGVAPTSAQMLARADLHGAGATFPYPLYQLWFQSFQRRNPEVHISYDGLGSESGTRRLAENRVDFAGPDVPTSEIGAPGAGTKFLRFAMVLGGVVPIYNLQGVFHDLKFTPETLADIYSGKITKWDDPKIKSTNKDVGLPDAYIHVIHRSDGSGTTHAWSDCLSKISADWGNTVGKGSTLHSATHSRGVQKGICRHERILRWSERRAPL